MYNADDAIDDLWELMADNDNYDAYNRLHQYLIEQRYQEGIPELLRSKDGRHLRRKDRT